MVTNRSESKPNSKQQFDDPDTNLLSWTAPFIKAHYEYINDTSLTESDRLT